MRSSSVRSRLLRPFGLALLLMCATPWMHSAVPAQQTRDVPRIRNGAQPLHGIETLRLEEQWRAGGEEDGTIFGMITRIRCDEAGRLYVLDAQMSQVHVYSPAGEHLRTLFREGEGPGEVRGPRDLALMGNGLVGVAQEMPGKLILVDRENVPAGTILVGGKGMERGGACQLFSLFSRGEVLLAPIETVGSDAHARDFAAWRDAAPRLRASISRRDRSILRDRPRPGRNWRSSTSSRTTSTSSRRHASISS